MTATKNEVFVIKVYDKEGNVIKTCKAKDTKLKFGSVRSIMALLNIEDIEDTPALLKTIYRAWDQVTEVLTECFPEMEESDWDNVLIEELIPVIVGIAKTSLNKILSIPSESKN